ncbi:MAG: copper chaperone PCu(A)C [Gemmatimonadetes bacterium]|uniref:Copper chaperone PCu(A)C n=1 Tax=Candidatus Kutchimonas denitrificans TaxID=3056748 RepID=A0AAE5CCC8_9BACT|nr:copper chaperone PCu(A)C [Gemmatimonadota bacterium]NIR74009.1 copper chaperone PCu(A)C [Candidatus Kutchimonas denitrificans]NIS02998.1 copper chaperone PCu(A)C [Gemmatimonadota bacterium]NIT68715.1 copper chaperone PCu(A)C [Gemmatimonadota bacterium]NIU53296.1 copper chaperone PCu(A)C [Gemmatimonadota bacterium]
MTRNAVAGAATLAVVATLLAVACGDRGAGGYASIEITGVYVAEPVSGARTAMYFTVANHGETDDELLSVSTPVAGRAEIHHTYADGGMMRMEPVASLPVGAGEVVRLAPGGVHVMLLDLREPLWAGDRIEATLRFRTLGEVAVRARVVGYEEIEERLERANDSVGSESR